jgi:hypothetical protein
MMEVYFQNERFLLKQIWLPSDGWVFVASESLNQKLLTSNADYVSEEARLLDEKIFFFVEDNKLLLDDKSLALQILNDLMC